MADEPRDDIGAGELPEGEPDFFRRWGEEAVRVDEEFVARSTRPASEVHSFVIADWFLAFLRLHARFGLFSFGPISIHVPVIEEIMRREAEHLGPHEGEFVRFSQALERERVRLGRPRIDELTTLLAFMRFGEGIAYRVFGELGVTPEQVEQYARTGTLAEPAVPLPATAPEPLYSPEAAAEYLGVHVQTVRTWIRSGRLRASRLAGQRALRIKASDLTSVLEAVEPEQGE